MLIDHEVLRKLRRVYRLTLAEMSVLLNVSESHLCRVENDERAISAGMIRAATEELALTPDKLARLLAIYEETEISAKVATSAI